jgi:phytoene dehydrogenase-like protein
MDQPDVVVVGAGLAGLCCGLHLQEAGLRPLLVEAGDRVGGRVRTDVVDGFRLDRGFQVLLTAYPEAHRLLDYRSLRLHAFEPGALVRVDGKFHRVVDPRRRLWRGLLSALTPVGSLWDKLRVGSFRHDVMEGSVERCFARPDETTLSVLTHRGFSEKMIDRFFRPFLGGVFLDRELRASSRMLHFVFRMFASGDAALPEEGMEAIPRQLESHLVEDSVRTGARVAEARPDGVMLESGEEIPAAAVVVATEGPEAARLLDGVESPGSRSVTCLHYAADEPPVSDPILVLNGEGEGPINNLAVPSRVAPTYAPEGQDLVSVSVVAGPPEDEAELEREVRAQLVTWFGNVAWDWRHLRTDVIRHALPDQSPPALSTIERPVRVARGLVVCGDHRDQGSIQGAMVSGHRAAEAVLADLERG